jgi:hypothetical protein
VLSRGRKVIDGRRLIGTRGSGRYVGRSLASVT